MKVLLIFILCLVWVDVKCQVDTKLFDEYLKNRAFSLDIKQVEYQFIKKFEDYCKIRRIKKIRNNQLDSLVIVQVNYLSTFTRDSSLTHLNSNPEYLNFNYRLDRFLPDVFKYGGEVCPVTTHSQSETQVAQDLFDSLINSPPHKSIMTNRKFVFYQFGFGRYLDGSFFVVGVFLAEFN